jgi:hypothetical protein
LRLTGAAVADNPNVSNVLCEIAFHRDLRVLATAKRSTGEVRARESRRGPAP